MSTDTVLDLPVAKALVRLRLLTEDAARRADDISEAGRHQALISLDGACEYALRLAARQSGVQLTVNQRGSVPAMHDAIMKQMPGWNLQGWAGVSQMHDARNTAQHAGSSFDRGEFPDWRVATVAFIDSLCHEAFGIALKNIVLASAVRDPELRALLTEAETFAVSERHQSFTASTRAFNIARNRWREQRLAAMAAPAPGSFEQIFASEESQAINELTGAVRGLEDLLEVQPFAGDLSEYIWFRRALGERASAGWEPTEGYARRALIFVAGWVVRWEIFDLGYPDDEWEEHRESIQPPQHGDGTTVTITGVQADLLPEAPGQPSRTVLYTQLANVPVKGREPWHSIIMRAVEEELRKLRDEEKNLVFSRVFWHHSGVLSVHLTLEADGDAVAGGLERAATTAAERYAQYVAEEKEREERCQSLSLWLRKLVAEASLEPAIFGEARVVPDELMSTLGLLAFIPIQALVPGGDPLEAYYVHQAFNGQQPRLANFGQRNGGLIFSLNEATNEIGTAITTAIANAEKQVAHLRSIRLEQHRQHAEFAHTLRERFGPLPGH